MHKAFQQFEELWARCFPDPDHELFPDEDDDVYEMSECLCGKKTFALQKRMRELLSERPKTLLHGALHPQRLLQKPKEANTELFEELLQQQRDKRHQRRLQKREQKRAMRERRRLAKIRLKKQERRKSKQQAKVARVWQRGFNSSESDDDSEGSSSSSSVSAPSESSSSEAEEEDDEREAGEGSPAGAATGSRGGDFASDLAALPFDPSQPLIPPFRFVFDDWSAYCAGPCGVDVGQVV